MNLWYMSSFKKTTDQGEVFAQVQLSQSKEGWLLEWVSNEAGEVRQEQWYAGLSWEELQLCYRYQTAGKQADGYEPCIEGLDGERLLEGRSMSTQMLYYYTEQHLADHEDLFEQLRAWRKERAAKEQVAPFIVASNRVLGMISVFKPQTLEELRQLPGIGKTKLDKYGKDWVDMLKHQSRSTDFPLDWVAASIDAAAFRQWYYRMKEQQYKQEWEDVIVRKQLLQGLEKQATLAELEQLTGRSRRELVEWIERLDEEGYHIETWLEKEMQELPGEQISQSFKWFAELGDRYLKPVMEKMFGEPEADQLDAIYEKLRLMRILYRRERQQQAG